MFFCTILTLQANYYDFHKWKLQSTMGGNIETNKIAYFKN
jgi:hypothetical protein